MALIGWRYRTARRTPEAAAARDMAGRAVAAAPPGGTERRLRMRSVRKGGARSGKAGSGAGRVRQGGCGRVGNVRAGSGVGWCGGRVLVLERPGSAWNSQNWRGLMRRGETRSGGCGVEAIGAMRAVAVRKGSEGRGGNGWQMPGLVRIDLAGRGGTGLTRIGPARSGRFRSGEDRSVVVRKAWLGGKGWARAGQAACGPDFLGEARQCAAGSGEVRRLRSGSHWTVMARRDAVRTGVAVLALTVAVRRAMVGTGGPRHGCSRPGRDGRYGQVMERVEWCAGNGTAR